MIPLTMFAVVIISVTLPMARITIIKKGVIASCIGAVGFFLYANWFAIEGSLGGQDHYPRWPFWWWGSLFTVGCIIWIAALLRKHSHSENSS